MQIAVIGTGYVGLVTGACLSDLGHKVICVDTDLEKVARLNRGEIPIFEPGLDSLVSTNSDRGLLRFTASVSDAFANEVDVLFIAVGTPSETDGSANLDAVYEAVKSVSTSLRASASSGFTVVVTKSTVPVGTSRNLEAVLGAHLSAERFAIASNPEFLREGNAIADFMKPDRIIIGSRSERARKVLEELYLPLTRKGTRLVTTSTVETAELTKYAANAFLATKLTFINELANLCEQVGADVTELARGVGLDNRIGREFLNVGPGFGGSCFPKDLQALVRTARNFGTPIEIAEAVIRANDRQKQLMVQKIRTALGGSLCEHHIGVLGLAFKANTDDMRDAPSLTIVPQLIAGGAHVRVFDPASNRQARELLPGAAVVESIEAVTIGVDCVVILTEWSEFRSIQWDKFVPRMRRPLLIDLRNIYTPDEALRQGLEYFGLGRPEYRAFHMAAAE
jgi:UDPglucose 6-dehydrogenase